MCGAERPVEDGRRRDMCMKQRSSLTHCVWCGAGKEHELWSSMGFLRCALWPTSYGQFIHSLTESSPFLCQSLNRRSIILALLELSIYWQRANMQTRVIIIWDKIWGVKWGVVNEGNRRERSSVWGVEEGCSGVEGWAVVTQWRGRGKSLIWTRLSPGGGVDLLSE